MPTMESVWNWVGNWLFGAETKSKEENDNTDYSEIDSEIKQFSEVYSEFIGSQQDPGKMFELLKTAERHIEAAKVALTFVAVKTPQVGLGERRKILGSLEKLTREMKSKLSDILEEKCSKIKEETDEATKEIDKLQQLRAEPAKFIREYERVVTTLKKVQESHRAASKRLKMFSFEFRNSIMQELESAEKTIRKVRASAEGLRNAVFENHINKVTKCLDTVEKASKDVEKMPLNLRKSPSESACEKLHDALKEAEKCYQEVQNAFGGSEKDPELKSKEEEIEKAKERVEQVESVISCLEETAKTAKHLEDAEKSACTAKNMAPKTRKTEEFAQECGKMSDAIKAAEASYQEARDILDGLSSDVVGWSAMESKLKSEEEEIKKAKKQHGDLEFLRTQTASCVCVVM